MAAEWMPKELPLCMHYGMDVNPWWSVDLVSLTSGRESPNLVWSQARHEYSLSLHTKNPQEYTDAKSHFMEARGKLKKWPLLDPLDHDVLEGEGVVVEVADGYRLAKKYGTGAGAYYRQISRPINPILSEGSGESSLSINLSTGYLSGYGSAGIDVNGFSWTGQFYVPVRYDIDRYPSKVTNRTGEGFFVSVDGITAVEVRE